MPSQITDEIMSRDSFKCAYCHFEVKSLEDWMQLTIDHIIPRSQNGPNTLNNLTTCCSSCNSITSRMTFDKNEQIENIVEKKKERVASYHESTRERWNKLQSDLGNKKIA